MRPFIILLGAYVVLFFMAFGNGNNALAESPHDAPENAWGIAMHGAPKYTSDDTHLDYANPGAPKGGRLKQAGFGSFDTLNPYAIKGKAASGLSMVYDRLMGRVWDEPFTMYPLIAERYETNAERSFITFHLNPKAQFQDGSKITDQDVVFSFETLKAKGRPNMRQVYKLVEKVEIICEGVITFEFAQGHDRETAMIIAMMPILSKAWWKNRDFDSTVLDIPNTNGPYKIKSVDPGRSITFERDPNYWGADLLVNAGHNNFDEIKYEYFRDDTIAFEAFKAGDLNLRREWDAGKWASAYTFPSVINGKTVQSTLEHGRTERAAGFIFNTRRFPFYDFNVRKALSILMDYDWINKNIYYDQFEIVRSYFPNSDFEGNDTSANAITPKRNLRAKLREAQKLLKQAGWSVVDGHMEKDGKALSFELLLSSPEEERIALHYKKALERLGVDMRVRNLDSVAFRGRLSAYDFDMVSYFWQSSLSPGTEQILFWGCQAGKEPSRWNYPGICSDEIDALAKAVPLTKSREKLVEIMKNLDQQLLEGQYMVPLFYNKADYIAHSKDIHHPEKTPLYGAVIETWWMEQN